MASRLEVPVIDTDNEGDSVWTELETDLPTVLKRAYAKSDVGEYVTTGRRIRPDD
jgi:hypothetical protein